MGGASSSTNRGNDSNNNSDLNRTYVRPSPPAAVTQTRQADTDMGNKITNTPKGSSDRSWITSRLLMLTITDHPDFLDTAERVLAHTLRFVQSSNIESVYPDMACKFLAILMVFAKEVSDFKDQVDASPENKGDDDLHTEIIKSLLQIAKWAREIDPTRLTGGRNVQAMGASNSSNRSSPSNVRQTRRTEVDMGNKITTTPKGASDRNWITTRLLLMTMMDHPDFLDTAERVLAHTARFLQKSNIESVYPEMAVKFLALLMVFGKEVSDFRGQVQASPNNKGDDDLHTEMIKSLLQVAKWAREIDPTRLTGGREVQKSWDYIKDIGME
ncbi:hypothetical protein KIPB_000534 [Kipferlia bialata]|uniref:Uncharacterized protein n=1 Tax=Kipferlia bialata TaxID=797122 RepID=A0A9K3CQN5_9EUKA|nr:hypothetical protein KIPB_000534 [Kipferlia bialata]|eukprot:g534.t1